MAGGRVASGHEMPPVLDSAIDWAARMGCTHAPVTDVPAEKVSRQVWGDCRGEGRVEFWLVEGLGHQWPGQRPSRLPEALVGASSAAINATEGVWSFFAAHPMP